MKMEETECSETSAYEIQTPGNYPEENIQHTEHGESLKSGIYFHLKLTIIVTLLTYSDVTPRQLFGMLFISDTFQYYRRIYA